MSTSPVEIGRTVATPQLPILATANDVRELIQFLKKRPFGVSISDISQPLKKRVFFPKKVAAYEFWGLIARNGEHLKLSPLGWDFARSLEPEARIYRTLLSSLRPYQEALRWALDQHIDVICHEEIVAYWEQHCGDFLLWTNEKTRLATAVCFFHLCQAAELGTMTIGKKGQPARLRLLRHELGSYLESQHDNALENDVDVLRRPTRVFLSSGGSDCVTHRITELLQLEGIESEVVERAVTPDGFIGKTSAEIMRRCNSCIIVTGQDDATVPSLLRSEIATASVLYQGRVLIVRDKTTRTPPGFDQFRWCEFSEVDSTWDSAVLLLRVLKEFVASP